MSRSTGRSERRPLIIDANVLIDYCETDRSILPLISVHLGPVHVATPVLHEEVEQLDETECRSLRVELVEPSLELAAAAAARRGALSFHDNLCLLLARENRWVCVTNDGALRRACEADGVPTYWGLETIAMLSEGRALTTSEAAELGRAIQRVNPRFISEAILERFLKRIEQVDRLW